MPLKRNPVEGHDPGPLRFLRSVSITSTWSPSSKSPLSKTINVRCL